MPQVRYGCALPQGSFPGWAETNRFQGRKKEKAEELESVQTWFLFTTIRKAPEKP